VAHFARPTSLGKLKCTRRLLLIQVGTINRVSEAFTFSARGADCDFATCQLEGLARFFEKRSVPTLPAAIETLSVQPYADCCARRTRVELAW